MSDTLYFAIWTIGMCVAWWLLNPGLARPGPRTRAKKRTPPAP